MADSHFKLVFNPEADGNCLPSALAVAAALRGAPSLPATAQRFREAIADCMRTNFPAAFAALLQHDAPTADLKSALADVANTRGMLGVSAFLAACVMHPHLNSVAFDDGRAVLFPYDLAANFAPQLINPSAQALHELQALAAALATRKGRSCTDLVLLLHENHFQLCSRVVSRREWGGCFFCFLFFLIYLDFVCFARAPACRLPQLLPRPKCNSPSSLFVAA